MSGAATGVAGVVVLDAGPTDGAVVRRVTVTRAVRGGRGTACLAYHRYRLEGTR